MKQFSFHDLFLQLVPSGSRSVAQVPSRSPGLGKGTLTEGSFVLPIMAIGQSGQYAFIIYYPQSDSIFKGNLQSH